MAIFCGSLGIVDTQLFSNDINKYMPFLTIGLVFWSFISAVVNESPNVFVENAPFIKEIKINLFTILLRSLSRQLIVLSHNIIIIILIIYHFNVSLNWNTVLFFPAILVMIITLLMISLIIGIVGARFRDVASLTQNFMQILFFLTPITWQPELLVKNRFILKINPLTYFFDILRSPLLGQAPNISSWIAAIALMGITIILGAVVYKANAKKVAFWI
jgi:ABC-type polysaccharide/polyol phosphate export permease